jgi:micrococcal nuclease
MAKKKKAKPSYDYNAEVLRVVDGDTLDARIDLGFDTWKKIRIRSMGIDTWESRTRDLKEKKKGLAAKARLKEILSGNKNKFIVKSHGVGKFGRCLGELFVPQYDCSVNQQLIEEGHAYSYDGGNKELAREKANRRLTDRAKLNENK